MTEVIREIYDELDGVVVRATQDVTPILDYNKAAQNDGTNGYTPSRDLRKIATIPNIWIEDMMNKHGIDFFNRDHWPKIRQLLKSSDYAHLRTVSKI